MTAHASVLGVQVAVLRISKSKPDRARALRVSLELLIMIALAVISGVLCAQHFYWRSFDANWSLWFKWFDYEMTGALFGAAVLCPYLRYRPGAVVMSFGTWRLV